jgi:hypothetical protein
MDGELKDHSPPLPKRGVTGPPREGAVGCMSCGKWPADRHYGDRERYCEDCYRRLRAEDSS